MRKFAVCILCALLFSTVLAGYSKDLSEDIASGIVRLHIVANSNDAADQEVKLKIRDALMEKMKEYNSKEEVEKDLTEFCETAREILKENGFSYGADAEMGKFDFPTKHYENFSLPKGEYEAVRIVLGKGEGENWWCVLFPPLCMIDAATDESDTLLKETFGENYDVVASRDKMDVKVKFKIAELF